jgi:DcmR-like sensory protein
MSSGPGESGGHVCLAFDSRAELESRARDFLAAGAAAGESISFIAAEAPVSPLPFTALGDTYAEDAIVDPVAQVAAYAAATDRALAAGYTGLRVVADVTPLARTAAQLDAFARYEYRVDRDLRDRPFAAVCAYDRRVLGDDAVAQLACLHAASNTAVPFRLHGCPPADGCCAALTGELDPCAADLFTTALRRADLCPAGGQVVLQAAELRFADHGSLLRLQQYGEDRDVTVVLRGASRAISRLTALLDLSHLRVESAA